MKRIKSFKLFESNEFGDPNFNYLVQDIKLMVADLTDDHAIDVVGSERSFEDEKDYIDIDIRRDSSKNRGYIKIDLMKSKTKQILEQIELDGFEYEIRRIKIVYLDRLARDNYIEFLNKNNNVDVDELLDGPGRFGSLYSKEGIETTGKELLSSGIGIKEFIISIQTKEGKGLI